MYDFPLVGTLHATSKELSEKRCLQVRPLYSQEQEYYMGSKGEALHCLSTLGKLSITSRHEPFSAALTACLTNGRQVSLAPETRAGFLGRGTRVLMTDIFCKLPIRRRILELSFNKELSIIRSELRKYCLRFPGVAITMFVGSSATATFSYRRSLDLKGSFQQCFPEEYSEDMSLIQKRRMNLKVDLLISHHPSLHKTPQFIFLNKRADAANRIQAVIKTVLGVDMAKSLPFVLDIKVGEKASFGDLEYEAQAELLDMVSSAVVDFADSSKLSRPHIKQTTIQRPKHLYKHLQAATQGHTTSLHLEKSQLSCLEVIGQVDKKYILCLISEPLCCSKRIIAFDQHAVHERVRLEWLQRQISSDKVSSASVMPPLAFSISSSLCSRKDLVSLESLKQLGFVIVASVSDKLVEFRVDAVPGALNKLVISKNSVGGSPTYSLSQILRRCILDLAAIAEQEPSYNMRLKPINDLLATIACRGAIKFNDYLTEEQCKTLLKDLSFCDFPFQCAHGRPTCIPLAEIHP
ncbi:hypothetical protein DSO57_1017198 [Entomophthora muscae]|uniref:Uncharacterized protein n=1 Tax=Entomophthora muscae TaxID=34485 RepID=A0ACC2SHM7_9FUNG|nr:hypothetical protein DSO57_1017198 [Entomophthora muscae]